MVREEFEEAEPFTDNDMNLDPNIAPASVPIVVGYDVGYDVGKVIKEEPQGYETRNIAKDLNLPENKKMGILSGPCPYCKKGTMVYIGEDNLECDSCKFITDTWTYKNRNVHLRSGKDKDYDKYLGELGDNKDLNIEPTSDKETSDNEKRVTKHWVKGIQEKKEQPHETSIENNLGPEPDYLNSFKWTRYNEDGTAFDSTIAGQNGFWVDRNEHNDLNMDLVWVPFKRIQSFDLKEASITEGGLRIGGTVEFANGSSIDIRPEEHPLECPVCKELKDSCTTPGCPHQEPDPRIFIKRDCKVMINDPSVCCNEESMHECKMCPVSKDNEEHRDGSYPSA